MSQSPLKLSSLKGDYAFKRLRKAKGAGTKWLNIRVLPTRHAKVRLGIVASKKVGKATVRNLLRRRVREGLRDVLLHKMLRPQFGVTVPSFDLVVILHPEASEATYWQLKGALQHALVKAGVIQ